VTTSVGARGVASGCLMSVMLSTSVGASRPGGAVGKYGVLGGFETAASW
jgi:hypothetical protein